MKKLDLLFVTIIMMMLFAVSANAATEGYYTYEIENGEAIITSVDDSISGDITIPTTLGGYSVKTIGDCAFSWCESLTSITIPEGVTHIGLEAFIYCSGITSITISDSVTSIGSLAFSDTAYFRDIANWKNDVLYIGKHLISAKTYISDDYNIKNGTLTIADSAFEFCERLTSITIPDSVITIGNIAFSECRNLKNITIPDSVTTIGSNAFTECVNLANIIIPDSVIDIGTGAFYRCIKLEEIVVPKKTEKFYTSAIRECSSLRSLVIKNPECEIVTGQYLFSNQVFLSGYTASTTEKFACENNYHFLPLDGENVGIIQNHKYSVDWKTVLPATCTERGLMVKVCNICSDVESKVISPLDHTDKNSDNICDRCEVTIATDETTSQQPNEPETPKEENSFFEKIIEWFRNIINNLFGWIK